MRRYSLLKGLALFLIDGTITYGVNNFAESFWSFDYHWGYDEFDKHGRHFCLTIEFADKYVELWYTRGYKKYK